MCLLRVAYSYRGRYVATHIIASVFCMRLTLVHVPVGLLPVGDPLHVRVLHVLHIFNTTCVRLATIYVKIMYVYSYYV